MPLFNDKKSNPFYRWEDDTLVLNILGRPNSKRDAIGRVVGHQLEVHVAAVPRMGGATAHMVRFLADLFDVSKSAIVVVFGEKNVNKQIRIKSPNKLPAPIQPASDTAHIKTDKTSDKPKKKKKPR
ncbi:MAG: DUF167 domain-containing protein [Gallionella sp.]|nr:DUF167 domain-containing protein [Gallionella sp.]